MWSFEPASTGLRGRERSIPAVQRLLWFPLLIGNGVTLGVFIAVAASVVPALKPLPFGRYVETQAALGKGYHPLMPIVTNLTTLAGIAITVLDRNVAVKLLVGAGTVAVIAVQAVSHLGNVPLNRQIAVHLANPAAEVADPRPVWASWHRLRTILAAVSMSCATAAAVMVT